MHGINLNPLFVVDSCEISCSSSTVPSKPLLACVSLTWMNASSPQSESLEQTTLEVDSPVGSILPILSDQESVKFVRIRRLPLISFRSQSYLFSYASKLDRTIRERMWIRREFWILILNSFFAECCRACQLSLSRYLWQRCSDSLVHCTSPLQKMKKDRLMLGNRYTLISNFKTIWVSSIGNSNLRHFSGTET